MPSYTNSQLSPREIAESEIIRYLHARFVPGDIFEIRALNASMHARTFTSTISGYFDYDHIADAAAAVLSLRDYSGVYVTINPMLPDLLARRANRLDYVGRAPTTGDAEVISRTGIIIDCDPKRLSGISSTDAEHQLAMDKAKSVHEYLTSLGWPDPVVVDSGNGSQLIYYTDLPADDGGLTQNVIKAISVLASDDKVDIDMTVYNPARIVRLPGTVNRKGDNTQTRPHRLARTLFVPKDRRAVTEEQLRGLLMNVEQTAKPAEPEFVGYEEKPGFEIDAWIAQHIPDAGTPQPYKGGRKWVLKTCPFHPEHNNRSAVIYQASNGAVGFRCMHNSCTGNDWHKLREMFDPGCYDAPPTVDVSAFLAKMQQQAQSNNAQTMPEVSLPTGARAPVVAINAPMEQDPPRPWRKISDDDVRAALDGTIFNDLVQAFCNVSFPPLPLAVGVTKALTICGAALSREKDYDSLGNSTPMTETDIGVMRARNVIDTGGGQVPNFYSMLVAPSSSGKDIGALLDHLAERYRWSIGDAGSAEGLAEAYIKTPNGILSISELQPWLDKLSWQHKAVTFLTKAFNKGYFRSNFSSRGNNKATRQSNYCYPNIFSCVQPEILRKIADKTDMDNGFLGRFLIARMPQTDCRPAIFDLKHTLDTMGVAVDAFARKFGRVYVDPEYSSHLFDIFSAGAPDEIDFTWRRLANEYYPRFAFVLSLTGQVETLKPDTILKPDDWKRAETLVYWFFANAERILLCIQDNDVDIRIKMREFLLEKIFKKIRKIDHGNGVLLSEISRSNIKNSNAKERFEAINELVARGFIQYDMENRRYKIVNCPPEWDEE